MIIQSIHIEVRKMMFTNYGICRVIPTRADAARASETPTPTTRVGCACQVRKLNLMNVRYSNRDSKPTVHPCDDPSLNDCSSNAQCVREGTGYSCKCNSGYTDSGTQPGALSTCSPTVSTYDTTPPAGRQCDALRNECQTGEHDCSPNADCQDLEQGFTCACKSNYRDALPSRPGRVCESSMIFIDY